MAFRMKTDPSSPRQWNSPLYKMTRVKLAFVLDCTASMGPWIEEAKTKMGEIVQNVRKEHNHAAFQVGLVAYRDYGDEESLRVLDFATPNSMMGALQDVFAEGGDDSAEDVARAFYHVMALDWSDADVRMVFHIADAPAHGRMFHGPSVSDRFPEGDPEGIDPRTHLRSMCEQGFHYTFVKITSATDTMLDAFLSVWAYHATFQVLNLSRQSARMFSPMISRSVSDAITQHTASQGM
jgi:hypothetical protein